MVNPSRYWRMMRINSVDTGYIISEAEAYFRMIFPQLADVNELGREENTSVQNRLLSHFRERDNGTNNLTRATAGLCLRCYVSYDILGAVRRLVSDFRSNYYLDEAEILPLVLNDDGNSLIVLNDEGTSQLVLDGNGQIKESRYKVFSVEVLRTFNPTSNAQSLTNWTNYLIRQNPELRNYLLQEYGLYLVSDWALLNRAKPQQLESRYTLSGRNYRIILEVFHSVYRRDRRKARQTGKCPDPSTVQLQEMWELLQSQGVIINSPGELKRELDRIAKLIRQAIISEEMGYPYQSQSLVGIDSDTGDEVMLDIPDPNPTMDVEEERAEIVLLEFIRNELQEALVWGIEQGIGDRRAELNKSRNYAVYASLYTLGLQLLYCRGMSQSQISQELGMTNQSQVSRVLQPNELLSQVRFRMLHRLLNRILERAGELGLTEIPPQPNYLKNLEQQLDAFVDGEIFDNAAAELNARQRNSTYAQLLCEYLDRIS